MTVKEKEKRVAYHGFTTDELGAEKAFCGYESFNCDCRGGRLTTGAGAKFLKDASNSTISTPNTLSKKRFMQGALMTDTGDLEKIYFFVGTLNFSMFQTGKGWVKLGNIAPFACITTWAGKEAVWNVLLTSTGVYVVNAYGSMEKSIVMDCLAGCWSGERMFYGGKNGKIVYSAPGQPVLISDSIEKGGNLYLPADAGEIRAMKALGKNVYVFCERAIYKIRTQAKASEFVVEQIPYDGGTIVKHGVGILGETMVILAEDGAYVLKNDVVKKGYERLRIGRVELEHGCEYGCFEGRIVFTYYVIENAKTTKKCLTLYEDGKHGFFGDAQTALSGAEKGVFFIKDVKLATLGGAEDMFVTEPVFYSRTTDLGVSGRKTLKKIRLYGTGEATLGIQYEQGQSEYALVFKNGVAEAKLSERGFAFSFSFKPKLGAVLDGADVEFLYVED